MNTFEKGVQAYKSEKTDLKVQKEIESLKEILKDKLLILGHHYQRDDVIRFADFTGDSLILSQKAASADKPHIVFCGVYFMAECADILTRDDQRVYLPERLAGCAMADMAVLEDVKMIWEHLISNTGEKIIPVTYINSSAEIKAFVGEHDGIICTSSNASRIFDWAMERGNKILFLPDQYLGMNTAIDKGIAVSRLWTLDQLPNKTQIANTTVFLWNGYCSVHKYFSVDDIQRLRAQYQDIKIIVHGECTADVVQRSDYFGSTSTIIKIVSEAPKGSVWAIGTEQHLVHRLQERFPGKTILPLSLFGFQCSTMSMITPKSLLKVLQDIHAGRTDLQISVEKTIKRYANIALTRMLAV